MELYEWSESAAGNNAAPPDGAPEGWNSTEVNAVVRELMAVLRRAYADPEWLHLWHDKAVTRDDAQVVRIAGTNATAYFPTGRRIRLAGGAAPQLGYVSSVSFDGVDTLVTVSLDGAATVDAATDELKAFFSASARRGAFASGTAAEADLGTGATQVPTNADLGSAAYVDTGTDPGKVPLNSALGSMAYEDAPQRAFWIQSSDQDVTGASGETELPGLIGKDIPGADGAKTYKLTAMVQAIRTSGSAASIQTVRVRIGTTGNKTDALIYEIERPRWNTSGMYPLHVENLRITPVAGAKITVTIETDGQTIRALSNAGGGSRPNSYSFVHIEEEV